MIDINMIKPDWEFAQRHAKAVRPGSQHIVFQKHVQGNQFQLICPCCLNFIQKQPEPLCQNSKELQFLGFGFPIFYKYVKYCIILLALSILSYNGIGLYKGIVYNQEACTVTDRLLYDQLPLHCVSFMVRFGRTQTQVSGEQTLLRIMGFIMHLFMLIYMRNKISKTIEYFDERTSTLADFAIKIKGLPLVPNIQAKIKFFFENAFSQSFEIKQFTLLPAFQDLKELQNQKVKKVKQYQKQLSKLQKDNKKIMEIYQEIVQIQKLISQKINQYVKIRKNDTIKSSKVIVIFQTKKIVFKILQQASNFDKNVYKRYFGQEATNIRLTQAPQPKQIIWENINYPGAKRYLRILLGWGLCFIFIACVTVGFYFILKQKSHFLEESIQIEDDKEIAIFLVYLLIVLVIIFNKFIMGKALHFFTDLEKHDDSSKFEASFAFKYAIGMFFTTALMTLAVQAISFGNYYAHDYGVIQQQTVFFFMNSFFIPLIWLVNPFQIFVVLRRKFYYGKENITQKEANHIMEDFHYDMGKRYAEIIQNMWFTFLYSSLIPFGAILMFFGLSIYYWVDKFNLLRRSSIHQSVSGKVAILVMKFLDFTLLLRGIGQMIFDHELRDGIQPCSIVFISIASVYLLIPTNKIILFFNKEEFHLSDRKYSQIQINFKDTYHTLHPLYSKAFKPQMQTRLKQIMKNMMKNNKSQIFLHRNTKVQSYTQKTLMTDNIQQL